MVKSPKAPTSRAIRLIGAVEAARDPNQTALGHYKATTPSKKGTITVSKASTALRDHVQQAAAPVRLRIRHSEPLKPAVVVRQSTRSLVSEARGLIEATKRSRGQDRVATQAGLALADKDAREDAGATPIPAPMVLGRLLNQRRKFLGLSQQALADHAGVGRRFLSELEAGKPTSELGKVLAVCRAAGVRLLAVEDDQ